MRRFDDKNSVILEIILRFFWYGKLLVGGFEEVRIQVLTLGHLHSGSGKLTPEGAK